MQDLAVIGVLVFLEGILSIDNALVLAILAKPLPERQQRKALTYGLIGAVVFRLVALFLATTLIQWRWVKFLGGGYLLWLAFRHFFSREEQDEAREHKQRSFWMTVLVIELTDIAFALDSILAAIAMTPKFWLIFTGGILGVVMMRFAASQFITLLKRFPRFENTAYFLVLIIGLKVLVEAMRIEGMDFHDPKTWSFWGFWGAMVAGIAYGFLPSAQERR